MPMVHHGMEEWAPKSLEEIELVKEEMHCILETKRFKNSRRFPHLFRYLVEETLEGRGELLKERLIGVHVLGYPADYDTAENPLVRVLVAEIRKRIAQYYQEEGRSARIRIDLQPGHYMPHFHQFPAQQEIVPDGRELIVRETVTVNSGTPARELAAVAPSQGHTLSWKSRTLIAAVFLLAGLVIAAASYALWDWTHPSALTQFWKPLLADRRTIIFCLPMGNDIGAQVAADAGILVPDSSANMPGVTAPPAAGQNSTSFQVHETLAQDIVFSDAVAVLHISNYLASLRRNSYLRLAPATTLEDLRGGPVILIGGIDNPWTLRALAPLPFQFAGTSDQRYWIQDRKNPSQKYWGLDIKQNLSAVKRDYAIIARIYDDSTGQVEVIVAGIGMSGTAIAGQFVIDPKQMDLLRRRVGPAFRDHNLEVILSTDVVNGSAGSPKIEVVSVW